MARQKNKQNSNKESSKDQPEGQPQGKDNDEAERTAPLDDKEVSKDKEKKA